MNKETLIQNQERIQEIMIESYEKCDIPYSDKFKPYFDLKSGHRIKPLTEGEIREMTNTAQAMLLQYYELYPYAMDVIDYNNVDDILFLFRGYKEDASNAAFLTTIHEELTQSTLPMTNNS